MDHSQRHSQHHNRAFQHNIAPDTQVRWQPHSAPSVEQVPYTRVPSWPRSETFNITAPALASRPNARKTALERGRLALVVGATLLYAALLLYMLSLSVSSASPSVGLTAQRDSEGMWRVVSLVPGGLSYDKEVHAGDIVTAAFDSTGNALDLNALPEAVSDFQTAYYLRVLRAGDPQAEPVDITTANQRPDTPLQRWGYALLGIIFISVGGPVFVKARQRDAARAFYLFCLTTAVALALASAMYLRIDWLQSMLFITLAAWAGSFAVFFFKFPVRAGKSNLGHYVVIGAVAAGGLAVILGYLWVLAGNYQSYEAIRMLFLIY
ncbi:MAG TPA: hypothetical protein VGE04_08590, partial [Chloroflexia bacterium]